MSRALLLLLLLLAGTRADNQAPPGDDGPIPFGKGGSSAGPLASALEEAGSFLVVLADPPAATTRDFRVAFPRKSAGLIDSSRQQLSPVAARAGPFGGAAADLAAGAAATTLGAATPATAAAALSAPDGGAPSSSPDAAASPVAAAEARAAVDAYSQTLLDRQNALIAAIGAAPLGASSGSSGGRRRLGEAPRVTAQFTVLTNAFAAAGLTAAQAAALEARPEVAAVRPMGVVRKLTISTPAYLGLSGASGAWQTAFGGPAGAGAGVLIGVLDTGITPTAPSFAAGGGGADFPGVGVGSAACSEAGTCNANKLVGCRRFDASFADATVGWYTRPAADASTCADTDGHGTHTASTAGGDAGAPALADGAPLSEGGMSGVAPGAGVAAYKVLWKYSDAYGTYTSGTFADIIAALQQAVYDGADVINYSIGGGSARSAYGDAVFEAFRGAAAAGVFVSAAGGNDGPAAGTVQNELPWGMTVAASTHPRRFVSTVTLTNAAGGPAGPWEGASLATGAVGPLPMFYAGDGDYEGARCYPNSLGPNTTALAGTILVCARGDVARVDKSAEAARVGAAGMIMFNVPGGAADLDEDPHAVPSVHLDAESGQQLLAALRASQGAALASIAARRLDASGEAPFPAEFSSRGPSGTDGAALLKPDISAPGVNVFAAFPPALTGNATTGAALSGTSMATPHIAGVAALIRAKYPDWSPAAVKSAMMTTASQATSRGRPLDGTPFDFGAGEVDPAAALDPGLVYDLSAADYSRYVCTSASRLGVSPLPSECKAACGAGAKFTAGCRAPFGFRNFNYPSLSLPGLKRGERATASRTVTYVGAAPAGKDGAKFNAALQLPPGYTGSVTVERWPDSKQQPSTRQLVFGAAVKVGRTFKQAAAYGQQRRFTITIKLSNYAKAPAGWSFGSLVWTDADRKYTVRSAIALQKA